MVDLEMELLEVCERLQEDGRLSNTDFQSALAVQRAEGGGIDEILVGMGVVSEEVFQRTLAKHLKCPFWDASGLERLTKEHPEPKPFLESSFIHQHIIFPVSLDKAEGWMYIIVSRMPSRSFLETLQKMVGVDDIRFDVSTRSLVAAAIVRVYDRAQSVRGFGTESISAGDDIACPKCGERQPGELLVCDHCGEPLRDELKETVHQPGTLVGAFRIERLIACGGMAEVYLATDMRNDQEIALKILQSQLSSLRSSIQRFQREARTLRELSHPSIVRFLEFGYQEGIGLYIATEFLRGREFLELLQGGEPIPLSELAPLVEEICDALSYAHRHEVIHRDLKPDNIFLTEDIHGQPGPAKLIDFGIAKILDDSMVRTQTGLVLGTPRYMSPEQVADQRVDHRADLYSFAVILYEALTNRCLFVADSGYQMMMKQLYSPAPLISETRPDLAFPPLLVQLLQDSLAKVPDERPPTMDAFKERFLDAVEEWNFMSLELGESTMLDFRNPSQDMLPQAEMPTFNEPEAQFSRKASSPNETFVPQQVTPVSPDNFLEQPEQGHEEVSGLFRNELHEPLGEDIQPPPDESAFLTGPTSTESREAELFLPQDSSEAVPGVLPPGEEGTPHIGFAVQDHLAGTELMLEEEPIDDDFEFGAASFYHHEEEPNPVGKRELSELELLAINEQFMDMEFEGGGGPKPQKPRKPKKSAPKNLTSLGELHVEAPKKVQRKPSLKKPVGPGIKPIRREQIDLPVVEGAVALDDAAPDDLRSMGAGFREPQVRMERPPIRRAELERDGRRAVYTSPNTPKGTSGSSTHVLLLVLFIIVMGGVGFGGWFYYFREPQKVTPHPATEPHLYSSGDDDFEVVKTVPRKRAKAGQGKGEGRWVKQYRPDWVWDEGKRKFVMIRKWMKVWVPKGQEAPKIDDKPLHRKPTRPRR